MSARAGKLTLEGVRKMVAYRVNLPRFDSLFKQITVVSASEGKCLCELKVQSNMLNAAGKLHGGVTASLVDVVSTWALATTGEGRTGASIDLSVSYLRPVNEGEDIMISAQTLRCGKTVAMCSVEVTNKQSGKLVAHGKHSKYVGEANAASSVPEEKGNAS